MGGCCSRALTRGGRSGSDPHFTAPGEISSTEHSKDTGTGRFAAKQPNDIAQPASKPSGNTSASADPQPQVVVPAPDTSAGAASHSGASEETSTRQKPPPESAAAASASTSGEAPTKHNPFHVSYKTNRTILRLPGTKRGGAYALSDLVACDVFVLEASAVVQIDDCTDCVFFIGPVSGSCFVRDCRDCKFVVASQQLRCRDLIACNLMLLCRTPPVIESSTELGFCCWNVGYAGLAAQLEAAALSPFHNFWSHVHDFTQQEAPSWRFVDAAAFDLRGEAFCKQRLPEDVEDLLIDKPPVLVTHGTRSVSVDAATGALAGGYLAVFLAESTLEAARGAADDSVAVEAVRAIAKGCTLLHTNKVELVYNEARVLCAHATDLPADSIEAAASQLAAGVTWTAELTGGDLGAARQMARQFGAFSSCHEPSASVVRMHGLAG